MLLFDDEMIAADPEDLPRRVLHDFVIYNAEVGQPTLELSRRIHRTLTIIHTPPLIIPHSLHQGMFSTLELVPMWSGVDHDVEIFASGIVSEDSGDWGSSVPQAGATAEAAGSSGSAAASTTDAAKPQGMRLYLSQIREWVVECGCDTLSISIRTDVAWYRLAVPMAKYTRWFNTVLKVRMRHFTANESSLSPCHRLHTWPSSPWAFSVPRLAPLACLLLTWSGAWPSSLIPPLRLLGRRLTSLSALWWCTARSSSISSSITLTRLCRRLLLSRSCAPRWRPGSTASSTKARFVVRDVNLRVFPFQLSPHISDNQTQKAFKSTVKARNSNPMRNKAAVGLKAKPMPATATTLVKAVWHGYFFGAKKGKGFEEEESGW